MKLPVEKSLKKTRPCRKRKEKSTTDGGKWKEIKAHTDRAALTKRRCKCHQRINSPKKRVKKQP